MGQIYQLNFFLTLSKKEKMMSPQSELLAGGQGGRWGENVDPVTREKYVISLDIDVLSNVCRKSVLPFLRVFCLPPSPSSPENFEISGETNMLVDDTLCVSHASKPIGGPAAFFFTCGWLSHLFKSTSFV